MSVQPALLSNQPVSDGEIPVAKPTLPPFSELSGELAGILESGILSKGGHRAAFEEAVAEYANVKHAVAVSSCTTGLMLVYKALELESTAVLVPSFTFMATVSALTWAGARPVFVDVDLQTGNVDPSAVEAAITPETSAIIAVHNSGNPADIGELGAMAERHNLRLIFDAAHALGSSWKGEPVGAQGDAHVFSLTPTKLVVAGEGGIITTNNDHLADRLRITREYGHAGNYDSEFAGMNGRFPELSAVLAQHSLRQLEPALAQRNRIAAYYRQRLGQLPGIDFQLVRSGNRSSFKDFSIIVDAAVFGLSRDELAIALSAENIDTRKYYDPPVHRQAAYRAYASAKASLPNTDLLASSILNLPIWSHMEESTASTVCLAIERIYAFREAVGEKLKQDCVKERSLAAS
jgi:dTDP-4-amino-4,6-dideoxygalactose transaminase